MNSVFYWNQDTGCYDDKDNFKSELAPPFPFVDGKGTDCFIPHFRHYYVCVGSVKEAEDWLLAHGYKKTSIETDTIPTRPDEEITKEFFIKNVPKTRAYSIVGLMIDYGDGDVHLFPFSYPAGDKLVNFSRFVTENYESTGGKNKWVIDTPHMQYRFDPPPLLWQSTDGYSSYTSGGRRESNNNTILEYDKKYGMGRYIEQVK